MRSRSARSRGPSWSTSGVVVLRTGDAAFELYTPRSSASSFAHALGAAAAQVAAERKLETA